MFVIGDIHERAWCTRYDCAHEHKWCCRSGGMQFAFRDATNESRNAIANGGAAVQQKLQLRINANMFMSIFKFNFNFHSIFIRFQCVHDPIDVMRRRTKFKLMKENKASYFHMRIYFSFYVSQIHKKNVIKCATKWTYGFVMICWIADCWNEL